MLYVFHGKSLFEVTGVQSLAHRRVTSSDGGLGLETCRESMHRVQRRSSPGTDTRQGHSWLTSVGREMRIGVLVEAAVRTMVPIASIGMMACGYGSKKLWVQPTFSFFQTSIVAYSRLTPSFWTAFAMLVCKMLSTFSP